MTPDQPTAATDPDAASAPDAESEPSPCGPCHGTGTLTSGLGGAPHEVPCPWCEGSGRFIPGHDAQEHVAEGLKQR